MARYCQGSFGDFAAMPLPQLVAWLETAEQMAKEERREMKRELGRKR